MKFAIAQEISDGLGNRPTKITELSNQLAEYFSERSYGDAVKELFIGIVCVKPEFEFFFKKERKKYTKSKKIVEYDLKIEFAEFSKIPEEETRRFLLKSVIESFEIVQAMNIDGFNVAQFKHDVEQFSNEAR